MVSESESLLKIDLAVSEVARTNSIHNVDIVDMKVIFVILSSQTDFNGIYLFYILSIVRVAGNWLLEGNGRLSVRIV